MENIGYCVLKARQHEADEVPQTCILHTDQQGVTFVHLYNCHCKNEPTSHLIYELI